MPAAPRLKIEYGDPKSLKPYPQNPRVNDHAIPQMRSVIENPEIGWRLPILVKDGQIIDGHLRWKAAIEGKAKEIPFIRCDDMSDDAVRALRLLVNKSGEWAQWDENLLIGELAALETNGFDLALTGFDDTELAALMPIDGGGFLSDLNPEGPDSVRIQSGETTEWVGISFTISKSDRQLIMSVIRAEREKRNLSSSGAALTAVCKEIQDGILKRSKPRRRA